MADVTCQKCPQLSFAACPRCNTITAEPGNVCQECARETAKTVALMHEDSNGPDFANRPTTFTGLDGRYRDFRIRSGERMQSRVVYLGAPNPNILGEYLESKPAEAPLLCLEHRRPKYLIVLTMYNQGPQELHASLWGIFYNIKQRAAKLGGVDRFSWRDYLLVIVQDGLTQFFNEGDATPGEGPRARFMHEIGIYNHDDFVGLTQSIAGEEDGDPTAYIFESEINYKHPNRYEELPEPRWPRSASFDMYGDRVQREPEDQKPPTGMFAGCSASAIDVPVSDQSDVRIQTVFVLKQQNGGKLDSHWWYFRAFARGIFAYGEGGDELYTAVLDVGTKPLPKSINRMFKKLEENHTVAGVAGQIGVYNKDYLNPIISAQVFEYKVANCMDKCLESIVGYMSVLPDAFCAYTYRAIAQSATSEASPLDEYLKSRELQNMPVSLPHPLLHSLHESYIHNAVAETDVPHEATRLVMSRRRWNNGVLSAQLYAFRHMSPLLFTSHSFVRKCVAFLLLMYMILNLSCVASAA